MSDFQKRYNPNRGGDWNYGGKSWKLSRSKIELYCECPRCFYLDNKLGTARPRGPAFTLNSAVDELFKREFDTYRSKQTPHPIMIAGGIDAIPFAHTSMNDWRENFVGITYLHPETNMTICGAVDDIWQMPDKTLIVVDYKSTSKETSITTLSDSSWEGSYRRQMGVYQWLLKQNGFKVSSTGYFVYANAKIGETAEFADTLTFETTLVPCEGDTAWIDDIITSIHATLESDKLPLSGPTCEYCTYREVSAKKLQAVFYANQKTNSK